MAKEMKLGLFIQLPGQHLTSWRHPASKASSNYDLNWFTQTAERSKFDTLFISDSVMRLLDAHSYSELKLDPLLVMVAFLPSHNA